MHIWMYSSGGLLNEEMDLAMMAYIRNPDPFITFVPSCFESSSEYFEEFVNRFERLGYSKFDILHLDKDFTSAKLERAMASDMIYLSGGNTFYFLNSIHNVGLINHLHLFVQNGGILAGHSAGSILMTPDITTASYPEDDRDENDVGLEDWTAMGFVNFEFYPHFDDDPYYREVLVQTSGQSPHVIYAVTDGSGVCINGPSISFFGEVWAFYNGEQFQISGL